MRILDVRRAAPALIKTGGRRSALAFGRATSGRRMLPDFLLVGAQRSGTTSLWRALAAHPGVQPPLFHKGIHYFDVAYAEGSDWYRSHFPLATAAALRTARWTGGPITGESSGYYMHHPTAISRIARDLPDVRVVAILRDPVERAYSAHSHEVARGFETVGFDEALELEPSRLRGEVERLVRDPLYVSTAHRHHSYVDRGHYVEQLRRIAAELGRSRMMVVDAEDFFEDPRHVFGDLIDFLGLGDWAPDDFPVHNGRRRAPMSESTRRRLTEHFEPWDAELAKWTGRTPAWRR